MAADSNRGKDTLSVYIDTGVIDMIEQHREQRGFDKTNEAVKDLVSTGWRETHNPLVHRAKQQSIDAAFYLVLVAVVSLVVGWFTDAIGTTNAFHIAIVLVVVAGFLVAVAELAQEITTTAKAVLGKRGGQQ